MQIINKSSKHTPLALAQIKCVQVESNEGFNFPP